MYRFNAKRDIYYLAPMLNIAQCVIFSYLSTKFEICSEFHAMISIAITSLVNFLFIIFLLNRASLNINQTISAISFDKSKKFFHILCIFGSIYLMFGIANRSNEVKFGDFDYIILGLCQTTLMYGILMIAIKDGWIRK